jgi:outer membrane protein assembly factor BamB/predicted Ser/Thr protein kinase
VVLIRSPFVQARGNGDPAFLGPFRVLGRLGRGGFGVVYLACDQGRGTDDQFAAVKVIHQHVLDTPDSRARFAKEIAGIRRLGSEYVPKLLGEGAADDRPWLATELVAGLSLDKVVAAHRQPLPEDAVWQLGIGIAEALSAIHAAKLVHRDLKPQNVLVAPDGPWIIDFGLVRLTDTVTQPSSQFPIATFQYAAPEQLNQGLHAAGPAADVFALGGTLLFAATGHPPHEAANGEALLMKARTDRPNLAGLPRGLYPLVESCLLRSVDARPRLEELRAEFAKHARGRRDRRGFAATLPRDVHALLGDYQEELAGVLGSRGPARLGWRGRELLDPGAGPGWEPSPSASPSAVPEVGGEITDRLPGIRTLGPPRTMAYTRVASQPEPDWPRHDSDGIASTVSIGVAATSLDSLTALERGFAKGQAIAEDRARLPELPGQDDFVKRQQQETARSGEWSCVVGGWICAPVAVHRDVCVVACHDGVVVGLRADDGGLCWPPVRVGARIYSAAAIAPVYGSAAVAPGTGAGAAAYVAAADGSVHAIDLASGRADKVTFPGGVAVEGSPVVVNDPVAPRVYLVQANGRLHAIDPRGRQSVQSMHLCTLAGGATGALAATAEIVFAADAEGSVHLIDTITGRGLGVVRTDGQVFGAPVPVGNRLYIAGTDGMLREATLPGGAERGRVHLGEAPVLAAPVVEAGRIYVGGSDGVVRAYEIAGFGGESAVGWTPYAAGYEVAGLAVADGIVYVAAGYQVIALDGRTGRFLREVVTLNCLVGASPVITGRFAYVIGLGGVVKRVALR